jgi:hypothetical protein
MRRVASILRDKGVASLRCAIGAFNSMDDNGRQTAVLLHLQHAAEMFLKAGLVEKNVKVMDRKTGRSIGFEKCLNLARDKLALSEAEIGQLRTIDALRDDEQHWLCDLDEELLFAEVRGAVGVIDAVLDRALGERLADHLPDRGLPITTKPLDDFDVLVDRQFSQIHDLLVGGRRRRAEARAKIRGLLAMEGHAAEDVRVSERDVNRVEKAVKDGKTPDEVFPRLRTITTTTSGQGASITVTFTKKGGAPVTYVPADDPTAAGVREVNLQKKFHMSATKLAERVGLTGPKATALRAHLRINDDPACTHAFVFGKARIVCYSDNAATRMREALDAGVDMAEIWRQHEVVP